MILNLSVRLCLILGCFHHIVLCGGQSTNLYQRNSYFDNYKCDAAGLLMTFSVRSVIECANACSEYSCASFFYTTNTQECYLCDRKYAPLIEIPQASGTKHYQQPSPGNLNTCKDLLNADYKTSGVYELRTPETNTAVQVYCDMGTDGGGWIVWQRRIDGSEDFERSSWDYQLGFGNASREYWLGLDNLKEFLSSSTFNVYLEFTDYNGVIAFQLYDSMQLSDSPDYTLDLGDYLSGNGTGGSMGTNVGFTANNMMAFSATNFLQTTAVNCLTTHRSGWWFSGDCTRINPNGIYGAAASSGDEYIINKDWLGTTALQATKLMIREQ